MSKLIKCEICNKECEDNTELVKHLMSTHTYVVAYIIAKTIEAEFEGKKVEFEGDEK